MLDRHIPEKNIIKVNLDTETICCEGDKDGLGHSAVCFTFDSQNTIICNYCSQTFLKEGKV